MYAVIKTGGKQYRVAPGDTLKIEKLPVDVGQTVHFDQALMIADGEQFLTGRPFLAGAQVKAAVLAQGRGDKITIIKFRRRKGYRRKMGHRQSFTQVKIEAIQA